MRAPLSWLREYVALPGTTTAAEVAAALARVGLEEEAIHGGEITGPLVVGRVLSFEEEPQRNGKVVRWCQVDTGSVGGQGPRGIVCGARNFLVDDLVVVCLPGAVLPGGFAISARRTYGHVSEGMICSARELGLGDDHTGILRLVDLGLTGEPGLDALGLLGLDEQTLEVNVTPDRGYAFSVRGLARECSHATGAAFTDPADLPVPPATGGGFTVELLDGAPVRGRVGCDRYVARTVRGIDPNRPSPRWMRRRLEQAGMRPISLTVDVTNYVMLGLGQPLHAFDLEALREPIVVRRAAPGESLTTLDDVERALDPEDLLICDGGGERVLALAGVMGGASTEVGPGTTDVLLEAAHFDSITVARTARRHRLPTEAGRRFERGVDTDLAHRAAEMAVRLLVEYGGGTPGEITDVDLRDATDPIRLPWSFPGRIAGVQWTSEQVRAPLVEIGCRVEEAGDDLVVHPPTWRPDLRAPIDLVEEVARLIGYETVPSVLPQAPAGRGLTTSQRGRRSVARALAENGLVEVLSYPFVSPGTHDDLRLDPDDPRRTAVRLANPLSDERPELRTSILATLLGILRRNISRGQTDVALFEIGTVTLPGGPVQVAGRPPVTERPCPAELDRLRSAVPPQPLHVGIVLSGQREPTGWTGPGRAADWTDALDAARLVARTLGLRTRAVADTDRAPWHPGRCARLERDGTVVGHAGELHPKVLANLGLPPRTVAAELDLEVLLEAAGGIRRAVPVSPYPVAKEDVALVVDGTVPAARVAQALEAGAGDLLESVRLFDVYRGPQVGEGNKSLAFALRLRAGDRTLQPGEAAEARDAAVAEAERRLGARLRA